MDHGIYGPFLGDACCGGAKNGSMSTTAVGGRRLRIINIKKYLYMVFHAPLKNIVSLVSLGWTLRCDDYVVYRGLGLQHPLRGTLHFGPDTHTSPVCGISNIY